MRKILSIILILLLLTGCATQTAEPAASADQAEEQQTAQTTPVPAQEGADSEQTALPAAEAIDPGYTDRDRSGDWDEDDVAARIALNGADAQVQGEGASFADGTLTITAGGVYLLSGELDGSIAVSAGDDDKVQLVLQDAAVRSADGPALRVLSADKVFVTVPEGSAASLSDSAAYTLPEGEDEPNACLYSKADLTLNGAGSLTVTGNYRHAVNSKDDLILTCGALTVTAVEDGLRGKDGVGVDAGEISVTCGGDGIHSSGDEEKPEKGWVSLDGGMLRIDAGSDGVQAATVLQLRGGSVSLTTGGGAGEAAVVTESFGDFGKAGGKNGFGVLPEAPADGSYTCAVTLEGGSGRATVESPATLTVADGAMTATVVWSSPNYDYMLIDGEKYLPINTEGNSTFEIPVAALDTALAVTADTVAMSTPHEIDYTLTFASATLAAAE